AIGDVLPKGNIEPNMSAAIFWIYFGAEAYFAPEEIKQPGHANMLTQCALHFTVLKNPQLFARTAMGNASVCLCKCETSRWQVTKKLSGFCRPDATRAAALPISRKEHV